MRTRAVAAGEITPGENTLATPIQIFFGGIPAQATYAGLAPGSIGLYQFTVVVPNITGSDAVPVTFTLGDTPGQQTLYVAVEN